MQSYNAQQIAQAASSSKNDSNNIEEGVDGKRRKVLKILDEQFDLEILLKIREKQKIEELIEKADILLEELTQRITNADGTGTQSAPTTPAGSIVESEVHTGFAGAISMSQPVSPVNGRRSGRATAAARSFNSYVSRGPKMCYARREDGEFVKITCPKCGRGDFGNVQGFINHCRLAHKLEFSNHDDAIRSCGTVIDAEEVPPDHPSRQRPIAKPSVYSLFQGTHVMQQMTLPGVCLSPGLPPPPTKAQSSKGINSRNHKSQKRNRDGSDVVSACSASSPRTPTVLSDFGDDEMKTVETESNPRTPLNRYSPVLMSTTNIKVGIETETDHVPDISGKDEEETSDEEFERIKDKSNIPERNEEIERKSMINERVKYVDPALALRQLGVINKENGLIHEIDQTRFHLKRRIVIGNVSERMKDIKSDHSYIWSLYITSPAYSQHVTTFITHVTVMIPDEVNGKQEKVHLKWPNLLLRRSGRVNIMAKVTLHFVDPHRNKDIEIPHEIVIDTTQYTEAGHQQVVDVELDRNTVFLKSREGELKDINSNFSKNMMKRSFEVNKKKVEEQFDTEETIKVDDLLCEEVKKYPLIRSNAKSWKLPYTVMNSERAFITLPLGRRKSIEWHRARVLRLSVIKAVEGKDEETKKIVEKLTTKDILFWCRKRGLVPNVTGGSLMPAYLWLEEQSISVCRFCGGGHKGNCKYSVDIDSINTISRYDGDIIKEGNVADEHVISEEMLEYAQTTCDGQFVNSVWNVMNELSLSKLPRMMNLNDHRLEGKNHIDEEFNVSKEVLDEKKSVGVLVAKATEIFLKRLIDSSLYQVKQQKLRTLQGINNTKKRDRMLTPIHVYNAVKSIDEFDFLTHSGLGS